MGKPRNTQKYPTYPEIPEIPRNTRKKKRYPEIPDRIFRHSYPTRTRPATRYFFQYLTRPDIEKPSLLGTALMQVALPHGQLCKRVARRILFQLEKFLETRPGSVGSQEVLTPFLFGFCLFCFVIRVPPHF